MSGPGTWFPTCDCQPVVAISGYHPGPHHCPRCLAPYELRGGPVSEGASVPHWEPIETAPMDGTVVLLYAPTSSDEHPMYPGHWWVNERFADGGEWVNEANPSPAPMPTHWMPLPDPPVFDVHVTEVLNFRTEDPR